jgi:hypothetical protein
MGRLTRVLRTLAFALSLAAAGAAAAGGISARAMASSQLAGSSTAPESEAAAQSQATALLGELPLPAAAISSPSEPSGDGGFLADPGEGPPATPNAVDDHAWWIVPGSPAELRGYIDAYLSPGSATVDWGSFTTYGVTDYESAMLSDLQLAGTAGAGELALKVVQLPDGSTGLRADAEVVWITPRPASEVIPAGTHRLWLRVDSSIPGNQPRQRPLLVVSGRRINAIVALLNALPAAQPGLRSCPADFGISVRLSLYASRDVAPMAVAEIDPWGCGGVGLTILGTSEPSLQGGGLLITQIGKLLGAKLNVSPPALVKRRGACGGGVGPSAGRGSCGRDAGLPRAAAPA